MKPQYLACIWCGKDLDQTKPYSKYCSKRCAMQATGKAVKSIKK